VATSDETPGGTVGCDVCGLSLAAVKVSAHRAWHKAEEDRLNRLEESLQAIADQLRHHSAESVQK